MDTPEKTQISAPLSSQFEESPIFSYINSLSPIKQAKSVNDTQTFNSLSFTSPSALTSPKINSQKEARFLNRSCLRDASRPEFCKGENEENPSEGISSTKIPSGADAENSKVTVELPKPIRDGCASPDVNTLSGNNSKTENVPKMAGKPASLNQFAADGYRERLCSFQSDVELKKIGQIEQTKEVSGRDWESLIADAADLLDFDSSIFEETPEGNNGKAVDLGTNCESTVLELPQDDSGSIQKTQAIGSCKEHAMNLPATLSGEVERLKPTHQAPASFSCTLLNGQIFNASNPEVHDDKDKCIPFGFKPCFQQQRSIRRLNFEMLGVNKKRSIHDYICGSTMPLQAECSFVSYEKQMISTKPEEGYSSPMIHGFGLHLNTLASASQNINLNAGRQLRGIPSSNVSFDPSISNQKGPIMSLNPSTAEGNLVDNEVQVIDENTSGLGVSEEFGQSNPKKKRRKSEQTADSDACKRCNCKKTKCLKLYCECFAAGLYCVEPCSCQDCWNKPVYEDTVLETRKVIEARNPLAFAPKVVVSSESIPELGDEPNKTPASARHKRGCNCKKSGCLKKYCECFQGGVGCSFSCRCEGCKNPLGCKYGIEEIELEVKQTDACAWDMEDRSLQNTVVQKDGEKFDAALPVMPSSDNSRYCVQLPHSSGCKPPQCSHFSVGSSLHSCTSQKPEETELSRCPPNFQQRLQLIPGYETPEILQDSGVKSTSPNSKRVSPPGHKLGTSPGWKSGRKLILRSISSNPSLATQQESTNFSGPPC